MSSLALQIISLASEAPEEVNHALSWGVGGLALGILLSLMGILVAFGGGREHT